jgi:hypothetical protein
VRSLLFLGSDRASSSCWGFNLPREEFLSAPIHSPPLWSPDRSFRWAYAGQPKPAGLAHVGGRFGPPFLALEDPSTLCSWKHLHSQDSEPFASGCHPQARERREMVREKDGSTRRKHPQVEKQEDTVGSVTMINGAMSSSLMG